MTRSLSPMVALRALAVVLVALAATLVLAPGAANAASASNPAIVHTKSGAVVLKAYNWPIPANLKKTTAKSAWIKLGNDTSCVKHKRAERWLAPVKVGAPVNGYAWLMVRLTNRAC